VARVPRALLRRLRARPGRQQRRGRLPRARGRLTGAALATGRYAPSPTGALHLGNLRTALLAWLFARGAGSRFLLRVDDLDPSDARPDHEAGQLADLRAIGLDWDEPVVHQSARRSEHSAAVDRLVDLGVTFECWCSRKEVREAARAPHAPPGRYPGTCRRLTAAERAERRGSGRPSALRLRAPDAPVTVVDRLHGEVARPVDDIVLRRSDGIVAYNVATVVDDAAMDVGEVVRGDDLLDVTPTQAYVASLLRLPPVGFAHVPLVLGPDGARLAKRHGAVTLADLGGDGVAVLGLLASSLGLAEPGERITPARLLDRFDPGRLPREPWVWTGPPTSP
jgi:glutamyl-tRNA synthetase